MFTRMDQGNAADWKVIGDAHRKHQREVVPLMVMDTLKRLSALEVGFAADQLTHSLMTATLAQADGATDEEVVLALCHDIGKSFSIANHGAIGAEMMRSYVSDDGYNVIRYHQLFQGDYYFDYLGQPTGQRSQFANESWYDLGVRLVDRWDMPAFDPDFKVTPLEAFEPLVEKTFCRARNDVM
ncbi:HD domain-containing protein [Novosphingobium sp. Chol11]|uniref:HD domain-containing protein n=1 Tax=Novosphingobium sp. Chol11 TaxID=1385763 RepID=UPI0025EEB410|nr:HD domain-containing protein [Novosphingobium sp. Chol11]